MDLFYLAWVLAWVVLTFAAVALCRRLAPPGTPKPAAPQPRGGGHGA
ncbi:MAG: hypothetical protein QJR11_09260 [Fulvimonas sp.]|nr:hypothetical protein [Fulvimonas sp.]